MATVGQRPQKILANNPYKAPTYFYPLDLGEPGQEPYMIIDIRDGVAFGAKSKGTIGLYMPPTLKVSYGANYETREMQLDKYLDFRKYGTAEDLILGAVANVGNIFTSGSAEAKLEQLKGRIVNPHMATLFKGMEFREFTFSFQMMARSAAESDMIRNIIYAFKYAMHPSYNRQGAAKTGERFLYYPDNFIIGLFSPEDRYLFKISVSVLTNMTVDYAGSGVPSFFLNTGAPVDVRMDLTFRELEIMTKERIEKGY